MLYNGLSQTSSLCPNSSRGSYCHSQTWRRSRRRTSSGFESTQACSDVPAGNRVSRATEDEVTEGRLLTSSPLAMFPHFVVLFCITGYMQKQTSSGPEVKRIVSVSDFQNKNANLKDASPVLIIEMTILR